MPFFTDSFDNLVDDKGRLSIPAVFRDSIESDGQKPVLYVTSFFVTNQGEAYLSAYAEREFQKVLEHYRSDREIHAQIAHQTKICELDPQGRVTLSPALRKAAGVKRDVCVLGVGQHIQIWDRALHAARKSASASLEARLRASQNGPGGLV